MLLSTSGICITCSTKKVYHRRRLILSRTSLPSLRLNTQALLPLIHQHNELPESRLKNLKKLPIKLHNGRLTMHLPKRIFAHLTNASANISELHFSNYV